MIRSPSSSLAAIAPLAAPIVRPPPSSSASSASAHRAHRPMASVPLRKTVMIVVNVLPLTFERNAANDGWEIEWSSTATSMFYRTLLSDSSPHQPLFVGCPEVFIPKDEEMAVEKQLRAFHCVPVYLDPIVAHRYFQGFCKGVLWPIFHNVVDVYNTAQLNLDECEEQTSASKPSKKSSSDTASCSPVTRPRRSRCLSWCDPASWNPAAQDKCWSDYCIVNRTFAKRIIEHFHENDVVWIQDFHFLMLPSYLLRKVRTVAVLALYLHTPFPSSEIFRCLAMRTEILRAMLCADHIGFLVFEHARHFLTSCKRLLGLNYQTSANGMLVIEYNGRNVHVSCSHIEPDVTHLYSILEHAMPHDDAWQFKRKIESLTLSKETKARKVVIASVDRLEGLNAIPLKLRAFDRFLASHPSKRPSVVLIQLGLSLDSRPNDYHHTREYVVRFVNEINRRYAVSVDEPVVYFEEKHKTTCLERMQLWTLADVFLDTCVRSGLSLLPFEFLVAHQRNLERGGPSKACGAMIVSEFASYSRVLNGCVLVNPWKTDDMVAAFVKVTEMQYYEQRHRFELNYKFLRNAAESKWAERLLSDFEATLTAKRLAMAQTSATDASASTMEVGFGFDYRVMQFVSGFEKLDVDEVVRIATKAKRKLFVFDYGGTLSWTTSLLDDQHHHEHDSVDRNDAIRFMDGQVRTPLSPEVHANIRTLCDDASNIVFVLSTGRRAELEAEFRTIVNVNLIADNGFFLKKAGTTHWECLYPPDALQLDWKDEVQQIMQAYAARTNGAYLIRNEVSLVYDYRNADPEYGEIQAMELYEQLRPVLKRYPATVYRAKGFVEVHQFGVNKAVAVTLVLQYLKENVGLPDFVFCAGDDESDEQSFKTIQSFTEKHPAIAHVFTVTVGMKPSQAKYYVDSLHDILTVIQAMAVRIRLETSRTDGHRSRRLFGAKAQFFDVFMNQGRLVSPRFLRSLSVESLGPEQSESFLVPPPIVSAATTKPSTTEDNPTAPVTTWTDWWTLGAVFATGAVLGIVVVAHQPIKKHISKWLLRN